jgi:hypothetical protein
MTKIVLPALFCVLILAQEVPRPTDPLERPATPTTTGIAAPNPPIKAERDRHTEAGVPGPFIPPPVPPQPK